MDKWQQYAELSSAAIGFVAAILIGYFFGDWLDEKMNSGGIMTLVMMLLGMAGAVINLLRVLRKIHDAKE